MDNEDPHKTESRPGFGIISQSLVCNGCRTEMQSDWDYCPKCGLKMIHHNNESKTEQTQMRQEKQEKREMKRGKKKRQKKRQKTSGRKKTTSDRKFSHGPEDYHD
jgi:hypothetical protein